MPCYVKYSESHGPLFMCGQDMADSGCFGCGDVGDYLCDYPVGEGKTCDRPMCGNHRKSVAPELDYCETHYAEWEKYRDSGAALEHFRGVIPFRAEMNPRKKESSLQATSSLASSGHNPDLGMIARS